MPRNDLPILTKRLCIRVLEDSDLLALTPILSNPSVTQYLPFEPWESKLDAQAWLRKTADRIKDGRAEQYVIERQGDKTLIGTCLYFNYDTQQNSAEFGYLLGQTHWRRGYMLEAMNRFIGQIVPQLNLKLLYATVETPNTASLALLTKLGFKKVRLIEEDNVVLHRLEKHFANTS